jgi:hypothetical protein
MQTFSFAGALIPLWILGAGLLAGLIELMRTPNPGRRA